MFVCFALSEGCLKDWCKAIAFVLPNLGLSQGRKVALQRAFLKNTENQVNNPLSSGATNKQTNKQKTVEVNDMLKAWEENPGEILWGKGKTWKSSYVYGKIQKATDAQGRIHA